MEIFYELMMKNGLCFLAGTNHEGVCEFSIDGNEFAIHTFTDGNGDFLNFSFSADTSCTDPDTVKAESALPEEFSVLTVRKVDEKRKKILKDKNRKAEESIKAASFRNKPVINEVPRFCARQGCVNTPDGWIYA